VGTRVCGTHKSGKSAVETKNNAVPSKFARKIGWARKVVVELIKESALHRGVVLAD
jgi:hypothetical protein